MAITSISPIQARHATFDSTQMLDLNHFSRIRALKPEIFEERHRMLFASQSNDFNYSSGNLLEALFGLGNTKYIETKEISDLEWKWKLDVKGYRPMTVLEYRGPVQKPGQYRTDIKILVDADLAQIGEVWSAGTSDKSQVVTVISKVKEGSRGFLYTVRPYTESIAHYINPKWLQPGSQWSRMYTPRGEAAESGGFSENFSTVEYKGRLVKLRKQYTVTDFAAQSVIDMAFMDSQGKVWRTWMDRQEAQYQMEMNREVNNYALYSRIGDAPLIDPDSGYPIVMGPGLYQQIEFGGNVERYTTLTADLIEAFFDKIVYSRFSPGELGEVIALSGHYGMKAFSKALDVWTSGRSIIRESGQFIARDPSGANNMSFATGYQFTKYNLPNGGSIKFIHNPMNDDQRINREVDEVSGVPRESQRITILDVTGGAAGSKYGSMNNIRLVRKRGVAGTTLIEGRVGPGGSISQNPKHPRDSYTIHISDSIGIEVTDPSLTGELIKV